MKLLSHELTHMVQYTNEVSYELLNVLHQESLTSRPSLVVFLGNGREQKRMAAEALAKKLDKTLFRADLASLTSKYIGETEKNLDQMFRRAATTGCILFFDEADALFGKRTGVRAAHDRYANQETNYLLRKIERHRGLVILSTNLLSVKYQMGRFRKYIVKFPPFA